MKKKKTNLTKRDIIFLCFLLFLAVVIIVVSIIIALGPNQGSAIVPKPTETIPIPTPTTTENEDGTNVSVEYKFPRKRRVSLNPNIRFELNLGGSESDTLTDVVNLESSYMVGSTDSSDYDFSSKSDTDVFFAVLSSNGTLEKVTTFGLLGNDTPLFLKPCVKTNSGDENVFLIVGLNETYAEEVIIYRVTESSLSPSSTRVNIGADLKLVKVVSDGKGIYVLANNKEGSMIFYIDKGLNVGFSKKIPNVIGCDILNYGNKILLFSTDIKTKKMKTIEIPFEKNGEIISETYSDKERTPLEVTPQKDGGFLISYTFEKGGLECAGIIKLKKDKSIEFEHEISGSGYEKIIVKEASGIENTVGYYLFGVKKSGDTYFESVCTHGDIMDSSSTIFEKINVYDVKSTNNGILVVGKSNEGSHTDIIVMSFNQNMGELSQYKFGGKGNDVPTKTIVNANGELMIFATTSSISEDVSVNFGKSDVWIVYPELNE